MNCKEIERKIYTNDVLSTHEKEHITICPDCKEVYEFNYQLVNSIRENLKYPDFKPVKPHFLYKKEKYLPFSLKPALGYAFILILGISIGYFVGNKIYYIPSKSEEIHEKRFVIPGNVNPVAPVVTSRDTEARESMLIPLTEDMKKEFNLYGGIILLTPQIIKNIFTKCNKDYSVEIDLKQNDIIIEVNGKVVNDPQSLESSITTNCNSVIFKIMRNGKIIEKKYEIKMKK